MPETAWPPEGMSSSRLGKEITWPEKYGGVIYLSFY
jgi:hypothetical protein